jgi:hypothetical protein
MVDPEPEEEAPRLDPIADAVRGAPASESRREMHGRSAGHAELGLTDVRASTRRTGGAGGCVVAVVKVSPALKAAIRAEARAAVSEHISAGATLAAQEAVFEDIRTRVRAAARELIRTEAPWGFR